MKIFKKKYICFNPPVMRFRSDRQGLQIKKTIYDLKQSPRVCFDNTIVANYELKTELL